MNDTQGFYKADNDTLFYGPNFVENKDWQLDATNPNDRDRTIEGWAWYDSEAEARDVLGIPDAPD